MMRVLWATIGCSLVVSVLVLAGGARVVPAAQAQGGPESAVRGTKRFDKRVIATDLSNPWELTWGPDGMLWVTERTGRRVTRVDPTNGERHVAVSFDEASAGGAEELMGLALHPELLRGAGQDYVYVVYTYIDRSLPPDPRATSPDSPIRYLYSKIVRLRYDAGTGTLGDPVDIIAGLPASNDHNSMRLKIAPDDTLHLSIGDMGNGQFGHFCHPIQSLRLPTREEIARRDYSAYQGKTLRINLDGSIPADNPELAGVVSHVFTYGHRNAQGLDFGPDGTLYATDHGPKTDDEVNVLVKGGNYGWPRVAGRRDDNAYQFTGWADATVPCASLTFSDLEVPASVPREPESAYREPIVEPIATLFTVPTGFNFADPVCKGVHFMCWPTVGISSIEFYGGRGGTGIPGWDAVLIATTLKRGSLYVLPLDGSLQKVDGPIMRYLQSQNRYRDTAIHPDGRTIYVATDRSGLVESPAGDSTSELEHQGAILAFTYVGEGDASSIEDAPRGSRTPSLPDRRGDVLPAGTPPPAFTSAQAAAGKVAYDAHCAVCHGNTLNNGTFGTPLAGEYFRTRWSGRSAAALYAKSHDTMPPAGPGSLSRESYAAILAYIFQVNGVAPGDVALPADASELGKMRIPLVEVIAPR